MAHYKIINITGKLGKRHVDKDRILNIEYHVGFQKKHRKLGVNDEMLLTCRTLPVSVHTLRAKNLINPEKVPINPKRAMTMAICRAIFLADSFLAIKPRTRKTRPKNVGIRAVTLCIPVTKKPIRPSTIRIIPKPIVV